jgi:hypothetical protein
MEILLNPLIGSKNSPIRKLSHYQNNNNNNNYTNNSPIIDPIDITYFSNKYT